MHCYIPTVTGGECIARCPTEQSRDSRQLFYLRTLEKSYFNDHFLCFLHYFMSPHTALLTPTQKILILILIVLLQMARVKGVKELNIEGHAIGGNHVLGVLSSRCVRS